MKCLVFISFFILISACHIRYSEKDYMPSFNLLLSDSIGKFNTRDIPEGKSSILFFFSPDCEHCQQETASFLQKMDSLKSTNFYFITIDPLDRLRVFDQYYKIYKYPNITLGRDYTYFFPGYFPRVGPPYLALYDKDKRLRVVFKGEVNVSQVIKEIYKL